MPPITRRQKIGLLFVGLLVIVTVILVIRTRLEALTITNSGTALPQARLEVMVTQNGALIDGTLKVTGSCPTPTVKRVKISYVCQMAGNPISLSALSFTPLNGANSYVLPIMGTVAGDGSPYTLAPGSSLSLKLEINSDGSPTLKQFISGNLVDITTTGLQGLGRSGFRSP